MEEGQYEDMERRRNNIGALISVSSSFFLLLLGFTLPIFVLPLMAYCAMSGRKESWKVFVPVFLIVIITSLYNSWGNENALAWTLVELYVSLSLSAAGYIWINGRSGRVGTRLFWSMVPSLLMTAAIGLVFYLDRALFESFYTSLKDAFVLAMDGAFGSLGLEGDVDFLFHVSVVAVGIFALPFVMGAVCVSVFFYENRRHSREAGWEERVCGIEFSPNMVWLLILFLFLFLLGRFVSMPLVLSMAFMSLTVTMLIAYAIQGFSVVSAWIRNAGMAIRSSQLFITLLLWSMILPGLNIIVLLGLPLLGVLENFFNLKTRRKK